MMLGTALGLASAGVCADAMLPLGGAQIVPLWPGLPPRLSLGAALGTAPGTVTAAQTAQTTADAPATPRAQESGQAGSSGQRERRGALTYVSHPSLTVHRPAVPNGIGVLVIAGGGYRRIEIANEALPAAHWLQARGYTAFVLAYRLPRSSLTAFAPLADAQRALRLIRWRAAEWQVHPERIGTMGFSAGGHLAGLLGLRWDLPLGTRVDAADALPARPDFNALVYPVVSLEPPLDHTSTHRVLVGETADPMQSAALSLERHARGDAAPFFLVHAADDPVAPAEHSLLLFSALRRQQVGTELHVFQHGGHGFAMGQPGSPNAAWPRLFEAWHANSQTPLAR